MPVFWFSGIPNQPDIESIKASNYNQIWGDDGKKKSNIKGNFCHQKEWWRKKDERLLLGWKNTQVEGQSLLPATSEKSEEVKSCQEPASLIYCNSYSNCFISNKVFVLFRFANISHLDFSRSLLATRILIWFGLRNRSKPKKSQNKPISTGKDELEYLSLPRTVAIIAGCVALRSNKLVTYTACCEANN